MNTTTAQNVRTHNGTVHRGGTRTLMGRKVLAPVCMSHRQIMNMHYGIPTDEAVTCKRCAK